MTKLSKREKVLIYILACIIIIAGSLNYLILPALATIDSKNIELEEAKMTKLDMDSIIKNADGINNTISKINDEIASMPLDYYPAMSNNEIDKMITGIFTKKNITPGKLTISSPQPIVVSDNSSTATAAMYITKSSISVFFIGTAADLTEIIDEVSNQKAMCINSFSTDGETLDGELNISIDFEVFMYENNESQ